jgi:hypothetical protein
MAKTARSAETAAEKYARLKEESFESFINESFSEESLKGVELFEVKCPSGMTFKCRKVDQTYLQHSGNLPMSLSSEVMSGNPDLTPDERQSEAETNFLHMSKSKQLAAVKAAASIVRYITVEPRLVIGDVNGHKNAISVDDLTMSDFNHLASWSGGGAAEGLKTFRRKR